MVFARGLSAPEGPVALDDSAWLVAEGGAKRGCVTRLSADGLAKQTISKTGRPNGLAVDAEGSIWVAESKTPSLLRLTPKGNCDVVATGCDDEPLLFPNDLCFGPDAAIYMTDSGVVIASFAPGQPVETNKPEVAGRRAA